MPFGKERVTGVIQTKSTVEIIAGERHGVAKAPRADSQRTATPTARGFDGHTDKLLKRGCCAVNN